MSEPPGAYSPPGALTAREIPFHVAFDSAFLEPEGETVFFQNPRAFADGSPKRNPEECSLESGGSIPAGTLKKIIGVSVQVLGAEDDDLFEIDLVFSRTVVKTLTFASGVRKSGDVSPGLMLVGQEWFDVRVRAPDRLREKRAYARVSLHGPYSMALPLAGDP